MLRDLEELLLTITDDVSFRPGHIVLQSQWRWRRQWTICAGSLPWFEGTPRLRSPGSGLGIEHLSGDCAK